METRREEYHVEIVLVPCHHLAISNLNTYLILYTKYIIL